MAGIGYFESEPVIALGVSGGADSMALALLLHRWLISQGGRLVAVTVDHGLRPEAADEAEQVGAWLGRHGISHHILRWTDPKPKGRIQEAARAARHRLLEEFCRDQGILHLALAHHGDDQAETLLMRLARGSGIDGLSAMPPVRHSASVRIIRPLLNLHHDQLVATCIAADQPWIEDPSNQDPRYDRVRMRQAADALRPLGLTAERLMSSAKRAGRSRAALEQATADLLAVSATILPEGWSRMRLPPLLDATDDLAHRALSRVLSMIGAQAYPPRDEAVSQLLDTIRKGASGDPAAFTHTTLASCRISKRRDTILVMREPAAVQPPLPLQDGVPDLWDGRFRVHVELVSPLTETDPPAMVRALGQDGWKLLKISNPAGFANRESAMSRASDLPEAVRSTLPSIWQNGQLLAVPRLGFADAGSLRRAETIFTPQKPLVRTVFPVV